MKRQIITFVAFMFAVSTWTAIEAVKNASIPTNETKITELGGRYYKCTGNNVWVRTGPGKQYAPVETDAGQVQLMKGDWCEAQGGVKNGYRYIAAGLEGYGDVYGWVSTKYLKPIK